MRNTTDTKHARNRQGLTSGVRWHFRGRGFRGFTLVEVLLAMGLTVVLMTALMSVATSAMQDRRRLVEREQSQEPSWLDPVARQIETDLLLGSGLSAPVPSPGISPGSTPGSTPGNAHGSERCIYLLTQTSSGGRPDSANLPVLVSYRLVGTEQGGVLLRDQRPLTQPEGVTSAAAQKAGTQVVATGIESVQIGSHSLHTGDEARRTQESGMRGSSAFTILVDHRPVAMQPVPPQVPLVITVDTTARRDQESDRTRPRRLERTLLTR